jgi:glycosyltransferase involved in cell wall biosynthesis
LDADHHVTPVFSVITIFHNEQRFLADSVASVVAQTGPSWELILVDDGSTDGSLQAVSERFRDSRIRTLRTARAGVSAARNAGIREACHPWIAFLDSDDLWTPHKLAGELEALESLPGCRIVYTDEIWIRRGRRVNPRKIHRKYGGWIYHRCLPLCIISPSSILLHRRVLEQNGLFDESLPVCEDYDLWLRLAARQPIGYLDRPLIIKRGGHPDQLSRSRWGMDRFRVRALLKMLHSDLLTPLQQRLTRQEIVSKAAILANGFEKRGKIDQARHYRDLIEQFHLPASGPHRSRP